MKKKILVTGGAGYIGSHLVYHLGKTGEYDLIILDNLSNGDRDAIKYGQLVIGDVSDQDLLDKLFQENSFHGVFHFAGSIIVPESVKDPLKYYLNNTQASLGLIEKCVKFGIKNFIFSSTAAVYGETPGGVANEDTPKNPAHPYGKTKLMVEWVLEDVSRAHDFNYMALRYFNVAGAEMQGNIGQYSKQSNHLIKMALLAALGEAPKFFLFGNDYPTKDGTCVRDFIHVDDLAQAHIEALKFLETEQKSLALNCGYGTGHSVQEVLEVMKKVTQSDFPVEIAHRREGDLAQLTANNQKILETLNWTPQYNDLECIIKSAFQWEKNLRN
jgi:UDP-glucose 4-epimerase